MYAALDTRKRLSLARIATSDEYLITVEPSGRIILDPAVVLTKGEAAALNDPGLRDRVAASLATTDLRPRRRRK